MKWIAAAALATASALSHAQVEVNLVEDKAALARLAERVRQGTAKVDHLANLGDREYLVFVDRSTSPVTVIIKPSDGSRANVDSAAEEQMVARYKKSIMLGYGPGGARLPPVTKTPKQAGPIQDRAAFLRLSELATSGKIEPDHVALIGKYRYPVYIDRSTTPITVLIRDSEEALNDLFDPKNAKKFDETLASQDSLVEQYKRALIAGEAPKPNTSPVKVKKTKSMTVDVPVQVTGNGPTDFYDCSKFYDKQHYWKIYPLGYNSVQIDGEGRPNQSWVIWMQTPIKVVQNSNCRKEVGKWGKPGDQGGHAIAEQNGGWGSRANFSPQNGELNNGPWRSLENLVKYCTARNYVPVSFATYLNYQDVLKVTTRPDVYTAEMTSTKPVCPAKSQTTWANVKNHVPDTNDQMEIDIMVRLQRDFCNGGTMVDLSPANELCTAAN